LTVQEIYYQKNANRVNNEKIKELQSQLTSATSIFEELKTKYEKQLKSNMDLKKQNEKIQNSLKKIDDSDKITSLEQRLDQTLVK